MTVAVLVAPVPTASLSFLQDLLMEKEVDLAALLAQGELVDSVAWDSYADWHCSEQIKDEQGKITQLSKLTRDGKVVKIGNLWAGYVDASQRAEETAHELKPAIRNKRRYIKNLERRIAILSELAELGAA